MSMLLYNTTSNNKNIAINIFKAMLMIGAVISHALQILAPAEIEYIAVEYFNVITFAGFIFSFGYVYEHNYSQKKHDWSFVLKRIKPTLIVFYISAIVFRLCLGPYYGMRTVLKIILLLDIPFFTEYILAFTCTSILYFLGKKYIQKLLEKPWLFFIVIVLLFSVSYVPFYKWYPVVTIGGKSYYIHYYIGLLFGAQKVQYFPVVQYFPIFLLGMWFRKYHVYFSWKILFVSTVCSCIFCYYSYIIKQPPSKWPPTFVYIGGSFLAIYVYYVLAQRITSFKVAYWLSTIGDKSIIYLLISNVIIFLLSTLKAYTMYQALYIACCILFIITVVLRYLTIKKVNIVLSKAYMLEE